VTSPASKVGRFRRTNARATRCDVNGSGQDVNATPQILSQQSAATVSFLGVAATATDRYNASVLRLNAALVDNGMGLTTDASKAALQARAMQGLDLTKAAAQTSLYTSGLGDLATTQDLVNAKMAAIALLQIQGAGLTTTQIAAIKNEVAANNDWARASQAAQIGLFDLGTAQRAANEQLQNAIDKKLLDMTQMAAATNAAANKLQALAEAAKVAGSTTPQLTQLGLDAANVNKQFDTAATTSLNGFSDALVAIGTGASSAGAAFQNFGLLVLGALEKMIVQLTIIKPLAAGLESAFGGTGSWLSALGIGGASASVGTTSAVAGASSGLMGGVSFPMFAGGGTLGSGWGVVGEEGPELINVHSGGVTVIPNNISKPYLPGFAAGGTLSPGGSVSRLPMSQDNSPGVTIINNNDFRNADPNSEARINQRIDAMGKQAVSQAVQAVAQIKSTTPSYLRAAR
jgi:hypothetical protein